MLEAHPHDIQLPDREKTEILECGTNFLACSTALKGHFSAIPGLRKLFHITIKSHYLMHVCLQAPCLNPRLGWCYSGEDFVQPIKKIAKSCSYGTALWEVTNKTITKYIRFFHMRMTKTVLWWRC